MKKFTQLLALSAIFLIFSCSVENIEEQSFQEKTEVINSPSQKLLEVSYKAHLNTTDVEWLKEELNVEEIIFGVKNKVIWVVNSDESIETIMELVLFSDDIISVKEVNIALSAAREGDFVKDGTDELDDEKEEGDHDSDTDREGDTKGDGDTNSDEE